MFSPIEKQTYEKKCFKCKKTFANILSLMNHIRLTHAHFRYDKDDEDFNP